MKALYRIFLILALGMLVFAWTSPALAAGLLQDRVVTGEDFILAAGESASGDLVILGGNVILEEGSVVEGDLVLFGGSLDSSGRVDGDVVALGGGILLQAGAYVDGDVVTIGGQLDRREEATITGQVLTEVDLPFNFDLPSYSLPGVLTETPSMQFDASPLVDTLGFFFQTFLTAALAVLVVIFLPKPTARIAQTVSGQTLISGGLGFLSLLIFPLILVALVVTLIMIPVAIVAFLLMAVVLFFGWIAIGYELGDRLGRGARQQWAPAVSAAVGTFLLSLVAWGIQRAVPCIGWIAPLAVMSVGLGALILTRLGTREYQPAAVVQPAAIVQPEPFPPASQVDIVQPVPDETPSQDSTPAGES